MEKSIFNFQIQYADGSFIDLHDDKNLWVSSFRISSPEPEHITSTVEGRHGSIYHGTVLKDRKIITTISIESLDYIDFDLMRDELFTIFNPLQKFYIIRDLQPAKRMQVSVANSFDIDYLTLEDGEFNIEFVIHSVFMESIGTTLDDRTFDSGLWQVGQGLISEDVKYVHNTNSFSIYNAGNIEIDPRKLPIEITYKGASTNLKIKNNSTGDIFQYNGNTTSSDILKLNRVDVTKNSLKVFGDTNHKLIKLAPGWNNFSLEGTTGNYEISFNFRFYYF